MATATAEPIAEENSALLAELIRDAHFAPEPGDVKAGEVVHDGDAAQPAPMAVHSVTSAGYVYVYNTRTGDRSIINKNALAAQLTKKFEDGVLAFTTVKPKIKPKMGVHKCLLHADSPDREHYDELGFSVCTKSNLLNPFQVELHMQTRHKTEWKTIQAEQAAKEKQDERDFQRSIIQMARGNQPVAAVASEPVLPVKSASCDVCGKTFEGSRSSNALRMHVKTHK